MTFCRTLASSACSRCFLSRCRRRSAAGITVHDARDRDVTIADPVADRLDRRRDYRNPLRARLRGPSRRRRFHQPLSARRAARQAERRLYAPAFARGRARAQSVAGARGAGIRTEGNHGRAGSGRLALFAARRQRREHQLGVAVDAGQHVVESWATPPASVPRASSRCERNSCDSSSVAALTLGGSPLRPPTRKNTPCFADHQQLRRQHARSPPRLPRPWSRSPLHRVDGKGRPGERHRARRREHEEEQDEAPQPPSTRQS